MAGSTAGKDEDLHEFAGLSIQEKTREVKRDGRQIDLTPREFDLITSPTPTSQSGIIAGTVAECSLGI